MKKYLFPLAAILLFGFFGMTLFRGSSSIIWSVLINVLAVAFFAWVMPVILKRVNAKMWVITGFIILLGLLFPTSLLMSRDYEFGPFSTWDSTIIFLLPSLALVNAAFLLYSGLTDETNNSLKNASLGLCVLLIIRTLYNLYVLTLWDNTYDPLGYLWLILPVFAVLLSGLALSTGLSSEIKPAGLLYTILTTALLITVSAFAQRMDFRQETVKRAERTVHAIESYYAREGSYPESLLQLRPWYALSPLTPMIIHGQDWCYESGDDYYRLGYIDREHWSNPNLIGRVYKSVGDIPDVHSICLREFALIQNSEPEYPYTFSAASE